MKLVTTLIANTKGAEGKAGGRFLGQGGNAFVLRPHRVYPLRGSGGGTEFLHPLIEFINAMEVREDDEEFKNPVDLMFDALEAEKPNHFCGPAVQEVQAGRR